MRRLHEPTEAGLRLLELLVVVAVTAILASLLAPGMSLLNIPRHGSRPYRVSRNYPSNQILPGAINVSFFDGHTEPVRLERLWQLSWHRDYKPPAKRPSLP